MATKLPCIQTVTVDAPRYPLYDHLVNPPKCYFSLSPAIIWDITNVDPKSQLTKEFPVSLDMGSTFDINLSAAGLTAISALKPPFTVSATLNNFDVFTFNSASIAELQATLKKLRMLQPTYQGKPKTLPWVLDGDLTWTFKGSKADDPKYTCITYIEVYVLPPHLPPYFFDSGIPLALLRLEAYLPTWMHTAEKTSLDWPEFAIQTLFSDPRLEYETFNGASSYITLGGNFSSFTDAFANNEGVDCRLDLWLSDIKGVTGQLKIRHTVNCYDLAALGQALVELGIDAAVNNVRMKYMKPFGFIKPTHLIGRFQTPPNPNNKDNFCNNPFYANDISYNTEMLCPTNSTTRSGFGNHMFLTINKGTEKYVLDACAGPQLGTKNLQGYIDDAIDATESLYKNSTVYKNFKHGIISDVFDGVGIEKLLTPRIFARTDAIPNSLIEKLATDTKPLGSLHAPYLEAGVTVIPMLAKWTFIPKGDSGEVVNISVFRFLTAQKVADSYKTRILKIKGWVASSAQEGQSDQVDGSTRIFCDTLRLYMAIITTRKGKAQSTKDLKKILQDNLDASIPSSSAPAHYIDNCDITPPVCQVGDTVKFVVKVCLVSAVRIGFVLIGADANEANHFRAPLRACRTGGASSSGPREE